MKKLDLESKDITSNNIELISKIFPHCITEQDGKKVIDFEKLKNEFNDDLVDDTKEKYELTWPGKRKAINETKIKTNKTLIPVKEKSVDFENTNNIYIEGDNLEVLKILQESYLNKIKCIYIDPPYNTGKDFIYKDDFKQSIEDELLESGQTDEVGNKFIQNTDTNGRYHSDWLSMMYPRIKLARNLLKDDGVMFISIDSTESNNLYKMCSEIFGEKNVEEYIWDLDDKSEGSFTKTASKTVRNLHEYIIGCYKSTPMLKKYKEFRYLQNDGFSNPDNDPKGEWMSGNISRNGIKSTRGSKYFEIKTPTGKSYVRNWSISKEEFDFLNNNNEIYFSNNGDGVPRRKIYKNSESLSIQNSIFKNLKTSKYGKKQQIQLFGKELFEFTKSSELLKRIYEISGVNNDDVILDFFSGSATAAHSLMDYNYQRKKKAKYILVQIQEEIQEEKEAYDFCMENNLEPIIPSIAQERIKRAGAKIKEETGADIDYGFKVFKLSDSILKENEVLPGDLQQDLLSESDSKYIDGISKLDIVTSIILDLGLMLDSKIVELENDNFIVEEDLLFISLSEEYDSSILDIIERILPDQVVLDEKTFNGSNSLMVNVVQQIKEINSDITINIL